MKMIAPLEGNIPNLAAIASQAMHNYGFLPQFPKGLSQEIKRLDIPSLYTAAHKEVRDLRGLLWSSLDNIDTLDFDQLEFCERRPNREILIQVAIADVDAFVPKGSLTDQHAFKNGTSVYTGVKIFSMLPETLSNDLSSLREGEDRLAVVIEFFVRNNGSVRPGKIFRALVHNKAKLIYESVGDWLEGHASVPADVARCAGLEDQLRLQDEAAQRLHKSRRENGALEFETIEPRPIVVDGKIQDLVVRHKNRAHFLIENFMVAANGAMAQFLEKNNVPLIQRVVRRPERWEKIMDLAESLGTTLPPEPDPQALADFLLEQKENDPDHFPDLSLSIVKLLGPGEYVMFEPGKTKFGHFGLAVQDYTHSTAPNRRFVDVVMQRQVKALLLQGPTAYHKGELNTIAQWCSVRDQAAKKVERFMRKVAAAVLLSGKIGETFEAIVTGASDKGTYVRLVAPPAEGRVVRGELGMDVGQKVRVRLLRLVPENGYVDFERVNANKFANDNVKFAKGIARGRRRE